jgi:hypothetical protein
MAIALHNDTTFDGNLKLYYQKYREDVFPLQTPLFAQFQKFKSGGPRNMRWGGKGAVFDVVLGDPTGWHWSDTGRLPESAFRDERQGTVQVKRMYIRQQFDKLAVTGTGNKAAAYVTLAQKIDEEVRAKFRLGVQEGLHGDGRGVKAVVSNVHSTTQIDVTSPYGLAGGGQGALWLQVGSFIAVKSSNGATLRGRRTITAITLQTAPDTYRVTLDAALSGGDAAQTTDIIVSSSTADDSYNAVINGLINITNRGAAHNNLHDISAATWGRWDAVRMTAGTDTPRPEQLLESDLVELMMRVAARSGKNAMQDSSEFVFVTTPGLKKSYVEAVQGQRQLTLQQTSVSLKGGYAATASCNGVPILDDPYCPVGTVYLLHLPSLGWVDAQDFGQVQYEGASAWRWVADRDAYETSSSIFFNTVTTMRNAHGSITGYTDVFRYSPIAY